MKLKNLLLVGFCSLGVLSLTSCGGTKDEKEAIEKTFKGTVATESKNGSPLVTSAAAELIGEENVYLSLTKTQKKKVSSGAVKEVKIEWQYDSKYDSLVKGVDKLDDEHDRVKFNYKTRKTDGSGNVLDSFDVDEFVITATATCGGAKDTRTFKANVQHNRAVYDEITLEQFYEKKSTAGTEDPVGGAEYVYKFQDPESGYIVGNHGQKYNFIKVSGKLEYIAPDYNWGLLSDGEKMLELYRLDASTDKDVLEVGKYYDIYAEVGTYKGNVQASFCHYIEEMSDHSSIAAAVDYGELPAKMNDSSDSHFVSFCDGVNNRVGYLTNVSLVADMPSINVEGRFTFLVEKDGEQFTIAHDYHVAKNSSDVGAEIARVLTGLHAGDRLNLKGTIRYVNDNGVQPGGEFQLTPFRLGDVVKVS